MNQRARRRTCPVRSCAKRIRPERVMCKKHWMRVPQALRLEIWQLYENDAPRSAKLDAIQRAIRAVNERADTMAEAQQHGS